MKLASYVKADGTRALGALVTTPQGDRLLDLEMAASVRRSGPSTGVDAAIGTDLLALLQRGEPALQAAWDLFAWAQASVREEVDVLRSALADPEAVRFLPPIGRPGKIIAIGANYPSHVEEIGDRNKDAAIVYSLEDDAPERAANLMYGIHAALTQVELRTSRGARSQKPEGPSGSQRGGCHAPCGAS